MEFWKYYRVLRRRRWIVITTLLAAIVVGVLLSSRGLGNYEASSLVAIPNTQRFFFATGAFGAQDQTDATTRVGLAIGFLRSYDLAERAVQRFQLDITPYNLQRATKAVKDPAGNFIKITVNGRTPREAVMLANAVADTAAVYNQEVARQQVTLAREFLERQMEATRGDLRVAENQLLAFQQQNGIALASSKGTQVAALDSSMQQTELALRENQAKLSAVLERMNKENAVRTGNRQITLNPVAQQLRSDLVQQEVALTSELGVHTEKYPSVVALKTKIEAIKGRLKDELNNIVSGETVTFNPVYDSLNQNRISLETEQLALLAKKEALRRTIGEAASAFPNITEKQSEQAKLTRTVDNLGKQLATVQTQLTDARLREQAAQNLGGLDVLDHARQAKVSLFGARFKLVLAILLGLFGGVGLAFFQEYLDDTLKNPLEAERLLGVPALASVPRHNPPFHEAYRLLRTNLAMHNGGEEGAETFLATSPRPREGTSTVVANLARAFARAGRRTVVVDAALQRPTQHIHFGVANDKGLTEVLTGEALLQDVLTQTDTPNLSVLPSGAAAEKIDKVDKTDGLLASKAMADVLADLKRVGDVILIDTPPVGAFSDVLAIAPRASGVLLVLDATRAPRGVMEQVKVRLDRVGAKVAGFVLTKVRPDLVDSYVYQERFYKPAPRRKIAPAAATAATIVLGLCMGALAGTAWRTTQSGGRPFATSPAVTQGPSSSIPQPTPRRGDVLPAQRRGPATERTGTATPTAVPSVDDRVVSGLIGWGVSGP